MLKMFIKITKKSLVHMWIGGPHPITLSLFTVHGHTGWESPMLVKVKTDRGDLRLLALLAKWKC